MTKPAISIRLGERELQAIDALTDDRALTRSRVIEAIIQNFIAQDRNAQLAALREATAFRRTPLDGSRRRRWST